MVFKVLYNGFQHPEPYTQHPKLGTSKQLLASNSLNYDTKHLQLYKQNNNFSKHIIFLKLSD